MSMKLAFSTLGCPDWNWNEIYSMAHDLGYSGIEIRGVGEEISAYKAKPFLPDEADNTIETLKKIGLEIPCFSSNCVISEVDQKDFALREISDYISLARKFKVPHIRILADEHPHVTRKVDDNHVAYMLELLSDQAGDDVFLLVETNGVYADTKRLARLIKKVNRTNVAALWDVHHTCRFFEESAAQTWKNIGDYVRHVHVKDSVRSADGTIVYRLPGTGDIPLYDLFEILSVNHYSGYVSLEWVKRWASEIEDAAIVFPQFVHFVRQWEKRKQDLKPFDDQKKQITSPNSIEMTTDDAVPPVSCFVTREDGQRIFEKDTLINMTFSQLLDRVVDEFPDQCAFAYTTRNYSRSYRQFKEDVDRTARMLIAMGVKKGDHVAIWATNYPQWFLTFWAAVRIGAVLVTVNTSYKIHEAEYLLRQSDTHTLVMIDGYKDANYVDILNEICPELKNSVPGALKSERLPYLKNVITIDGRYDGCYYWDEALALGQHIPENLLSKMSSETHPDEVCNMQYTSGTTGFPKGVMLTHNNVINNGKCIGDCMDFTTADRLLIQVPMFHCFGMVLAMIASVTHGSTMVPIEYFQPVKALEAINMRKITAMHGVPTMFIALLEHELFSKTDFTYMRTGIMAGSPCPVPVMEAVLEKMNMKDITIVFGQTESSPGCTQSRVGDPIEVRVSTVGRPLPGVECKIVDPATNEELPDNEPGEFVARGYNIMKGYYKMPEATKAAIDEDGWLHTGDLAIRTPEGNYKITGRIKDMIIRGGENIYPKEIEEFLYTHPAVRDVQVIGVPDKTYGEEIMACIILKDGESITEEEMKEYVKTHMAKHKTPKYVAFVNEFPMNAAGKIMKYKMREHAVKELGLETDAGIETA